MIGRRLPVVEDDASLRQCLTEYLAEAGFDVAEAEDGDHAVTMLDDIDLLITDIDMPGRLDGNALAVRAKARRPGSPVIYASGSPALLSNEIKVNDALLLKPTGPARVAAMATCLLQAAEQVCHRDTPASSSKKRCPRLWTGSPVSNFIRSTAL